MEKNNQGPSPIAWKFTIHGFFKKIQSSEVFVYLDDIQYERNDWDNVLLTQY